MRDSVYVSDYEHKPAPAPALLSLESYTHVGLCRFACAIYSPGPSCLLWSVISFCVCVGLASVVAHFLVVQGVMLEEKVLCAEVLL